MNPAGPNPGPPIMQENLNFAIEFQSVLLRLGFLATEVFELKSSFEDFRRRNPQITRAQTLLREFGNRLSVYPPSNVSRINQALLLKFLGNSVDDIRNYLARDPPPPPPRPVFTTLQTIEQRQHYYQHILDSIMRSVAANSPQDNATASLVNAATSLNNAAAVGDATSLNEAANSLAVAANLLNNQQHSSIVFVYDIDDLVIISIAFITEYIIQTPEINMGLLSSLMLGIIDFLDFRGTELRATNVGNIAEIDPNGPVFEIYDRLKQFYNEMSRIQGEGPIISHELIDKAGMTPQRDDLIEAAEQFQQKYGQRWQHAKNCLKLVNEKTRESDKKYNNILLTKEKIGYACIQMLISGMCSEIPADNIYSIDGRSKEAVFDKIQRRFGEKCVLVYVTAACALNQVPIRLQNHAWPVEGTQSFEGLYNALRETLLR